MKNFLTPNGEKEIKESQVKAKKIGFKIRE